MNRFHSRVIDVKASTTMLGPKCSQLLGLHDVSGCDTNGYFFRKSNLNALHLLRKNDCPLLHSLLGEETSSQSEVVQGWNYFIIFMQKRDILEPLTKIYQRCKSKMPPIKVLPPTLPNFALHMKRAHLHVMMWKAAPPTAAVAANISKVGWEVRDGVVFIPAIHTGSPVPA